MMRDKEVSRDRKTLLILIAGGALAGGGYLAYRWWSKRPSSSTQKPPVTKDKEKQKSSASDLFAQRETVYPQTEKFELRAPPFVKERISLPSDAAADLSTSSTFEKVPSSSASPEPDSFVQLSISSYQDLPEVSGAGSPGGVKSEAEKTAADELTASQMDDSSIELLSESSMSFVGVSSLPPAAEPVHSPPTSTDDDRRTVRMEDKNDMVHIERPSGDDGAGEDGDRETPVMMGPGGDAPTGDGETVEYDDDDEPEEDAPPAVPASGPPQTEEDNLVAEDDEEDDEDGGDETVEYNVSIPGNTADAAEE